MVKDIDINTSFEGERRVLQCPQKEFLHRAAELFNVDIVDMVLFEVCKGERRRKISYHDITDFMHVEIVRKSALAAAKSPRTLRSYFCNETSKKENFIGQIITKLKNNSPLTGIQRKHLLEWIEEYSKIPSAVKRKVDEVNGIIETSHKKVQVQLAANSKHEFTQTDISEILPSRSTSRKDHVITQIKKLAANGEQSTDEIFRLMSESFDDRRNYILIKHPPVSAVRNKYPSLFTTCEVKNELDRIFYPGKQTEFVQNIGKYSKAILAVGSKKTDEILIKIQNALKLCHAEQKKYVKDIGSILRVPKLMKEPMGFISLADNPVEDDVYPYIDASHMEIDELFYVDSPSFKIVVEGQLLCEAYDLKEAILCLIACFFIFNINYPEICYKTYVIFEKLYLSANDTFEVDDFTEQMIKLLKMKTSDSGF